MYLFYIVEKYHEADKQIIPLRYFALWLNVESLNSFLNV